MPPAGASRPTRRELFDKEALPHLDHLYSVAMHLARSRDDASDMVQETMLRALRFFDQFTPGTNCRAWLLTILYNVFRNRYRQSASERVARTEEEFESQVEEMGLRSEAPSTNPETVIFDRVLGAEVQAALDSLPEDFRTVLLLVDLQELRYAEAAGVLDVPVGTVRSRVSRARGMLKKALAAFARARGYTRGSGG
jgi:RNA polymerase sigma-70 factor (ECF subfamily)